MGVANTDEKQRNAAIAKQAADDVWRANGPVTAWEKANLVQAGGDPWYQSDFERFHGNTMSTANADEKERVASVMKQAAADKWRSSGPVIAWEKGAALAQEDPWYQKDFEAGHKYVMDRANADETARVAAVNGQ